MSNEVKDFIGVILVVGIVALLLIMISVYNDVEETKMKLNTVAAVCKDTNSSNCINVLLKLKLD